MTPDRRTVLLGGVGLAGAAALAACSSGGGTTGSGSTSGTAAASPTGPTYVGDLQVVALSAALENLATTAYAQLLARAGQGAFGAVPAAVTTFATTAQEHHTDHAGAWNSLLTQAGKTAITGTPLSDAQDLLGPLASARTLGDALHAVAAVEAAAASTHLETVGAVVGGGPVRLAATIAPVEAQHGAVLALLLGTAPVPATFLTLSAAISPGSLTV